MGESANTDSRYPNSNSRTAASLSSNLLTAYRSVAAVVGHDLWLCGLTLVFESATQDKIVTLATSIGTGPDSIPNRLQRGERQLPEGDAVVAEAVTGTARTMNRCGAGPW